MSSEMMFTFTRGDAELHRQTIDINLNSFLFETFILLFTLFSAELLSVIHPAFNNATKLIKTENSHAIGNTYVRKSILHKLYV